ncbi:hypothetical protein [Alicyclobacillus ferrooxydans]|uniref:Uncharacterized protein n=1 Tax=Alicyclobacillus ferrooxydans TaxID=471514 RepID=A0A0P9ENA5_9BACL|nr:hypothetical protein [Alicyclobacillus ferrooxydans]KPV44923.1 hypothetical protein AN477_04735 [Alicyclobacillus ferrooxydans]
MRESKEAISFKNKAARPFMKATPEKTGNVIDFMPYLTAKQKQTARHATFLTLFLIFLSIFIVVI